MFSRVPEGALPGQLEWVALCVRHYQGSLTTALVTPKSAAEASGCQTHPELLGSPTLAKVALPGKIKPCG